MSRIGKSKMRDWHRFFVQKLMSHGFMTGIEVFIFTKCLVEKFTGTPGFPKIDLDDNGEVGDFLDDLYKTSNENLEKVNFQIKRGKQEVKEDDKYALCYAFVPTEENEQIAKMQKIFTESELDFLKTICFHLADEKTATENKLINLCIEGGLNNSTRKKLTTVEAARVVKTFTELGYIMNTRKHNRAGSKGGTYHLGARLILELENWFEKNIEVEICRACNKPVFVSVECTTRNCDNSYHRYCVESKPKCKQCKNPIKLEGAASKR